MAGVREDHPRLALPRGAPGRRSVGVLVLLLFAAVAAIVFMTRLSRRPAHLAPIETAAAETEAPVPASAPADVPEAAPAAAAAAAPTAAAEDPQISARKEADIARVVADGRSGLSACYQRALVRDSTLVHGNMTIRASVAPSGRVDAVNISGPAAFRTMDPCLKRAVSQWTFPSAAAPYVAEFPIRLRGAE